jgi:iron complex transport system ATP-binding protein
VSALVEARGLAIAGRLHNTSLSLADGELVCLIGPNGGGKTSLLHAFAGIPPATGKVLVAGQDPHGLAPEQRQRLLAFLPASREVKWPVSGRDLVALGLPARPDPAVIETLSIQLGLGELMERRVDRLSTGERSRLLIARALAAGPRLLLLDEPTANLDPLWQLKLMDYLKSLVRADGRSVLLAVHDLETARRYGDRLLVMSGGRLQADGAPGPILDGPLMDEVFGIENRSGRWEAAR